MLTFVCNVWFPISSLGLTDANMRQLVLSLRPELCLEKKADDMWQIKLIAPSTTKVIDFKSGDEVDQISIVGRPVKVNILFCTSSS